MKPTDGVPQTDAKHNDSNESAIFPVGSLGFMLSPTRSQQPMFGDQMVFLHRGILKQLVSVGFP